MDYFLSLLAALVFALTLTVYAQTNEPGNSTQSSSPSQTVKTADEMMILAAQEMQSDPKKALIDLTEAIKLRPDFVDAFFVRSSIESGLGDRVTALADITRVIELKPDMGLAYYNRALYRDISDNTGVANAIKDLDLAVTHNYKGDYVYSMRAALKQRIGDLKGVVEDLDQAIKLNPDNPQTYFQRAEQLYRLGDKDRAFDDVDFLLKWYGD